ncbi:MAG: MBL fold metallo-hydrolase [Deltaproteobacteria bacterium]|nr:MBL fold metallo-hydrolase [Deltaproteobacteria bacterium]
MLVLREDLAVSVLYDDESRFGSALTRRADEVAREVFRPLYQAMLGERPEAPSALRGVVRRRAAFRAATESLGRRGWLVRPEVLYPDPARTRPAVLTIGPTPEAPSLLLEVAPSRWREIHDVVAALATVGVERSSQHPVVRAMYARGLLREQEATLPYEEEADLRFVGHNTAVVRSARATIVTDPLLLPRGPEDHDYAPLPRAKLGPVQAILITHSHVDHFHPGSLLQFDRRTLVIVPHVPRESLLSPDMAHRAREFGFENVEILRWGESRWIEDIEVVALPFYGEQPTVGVRLHPEVRNCGNTYFVRTPKLSMAFLADTGRDERGDMLTDVAPSIRSLGPPDLLFVGHRGVTLKPVDLLSSDLARYFYFVPPEAWEEPQQLMTTSQEAAAIAEATDTSFVVPYAAGGAPWHWRLGLGPNLHAPDSENPDVNPFPERFVEYCRPGGPHPLVLRPGDGLAREGQQLKLLRTRPHAWPGP